MIRIMISIIISSLICGNLADKVVEAINNMEAAIGDTISSTQSLPSESRFRQRCCCCCFHGLVCFVFMSTGLSFLIAFLAFVYCFCTQKHRLSATRHSPSANRSVGKQNSRTHHEQNIFLLIISEFYFCCNDLTNSSQRAADQVLFHFAEA